MAPVIYAGVQSNDYLDTDSIWKAYRTIFNASQSKTVLHETNECVCDTAAILSDQQEAAGAADRERGAGDWVSPLSLCLCVCL